MAFQCYLAVTVILRLSHLSLYRIIAWSMLKHSGAHGLFNFSLSQLPSHGQELVQS